MADAPVTSRRLADGVFDLQFQSTARREVDGGERVIVSVPRTPAPRWVGELVDEASQPDRLGQFLDTYGPMVQATRDLMLPLVQCWRGFQEEDPREAANQVLAALRVLASQAPESERLIGELVQTRRTPAGCSAPLTDVDLLRALAGHKGRETLDVASLHISRRTRNVMVTTPQLLGSILEAVPSRPGAAAKEILDTLAAEAQGASLAEWLSVDPEGVTTLLRLRPAIATRPEIWRALGSETAWDVVKRVRGRRRRVEILAAIVAAEIEIDPDWVAKSWKGTAPALVVRLADEGATPRLLGPWVDSLTSGEKRELAHAQGQPDVLTDTLIARTSPAQLAQWDLDWLHGWIAKPRPPAAYANLFLAALRNAQRPSWAPLAVALYEQLHRMETKSSTRDVRAARKILTQLASAEGTQERGSDSASVLSRALRDPHWPATAALACRNRPAFRALIDADDDAGLARSILEAGVEGMTDMTPWQRSTVLATVAAKSDRDALAKIVEGFESVLSAAAAAWSAVRGR